MLFALCIHNNHTCTRTRTHAHTHTHAHIHACTLSHVCTHKRTYMIVLYAIHVHAPINTRVVYRCAVHTCIYVMQLISVCLSHCEKQKS